MRDGWLAYIHLFDQFFDLRNTLSNFSENFEAGSVSQQRKTIDTFFGTCLVHRLIDECLWDSNGGLSICLVLCWHIKHCMDLHIMSLRDAIAYVPDKPTHAIRIFSSFSLEARKFELRQASEHYRRIVEYVFDDNFPGFRAGPVSMTPNLADRLVKDFVDHRSQVQALLVHCTHGKNRAPAVAIALNEIFGLGHNTSELKTKFPESNWEIYRTILAAGRKI